MLSKTVEAPEAAFAMPLPSLIENVTFCLPEAVVESVMAEKLWMESVSTNAVEASPVVSVCPPGFPFIPGGVIPSGMAGISPEGGSGGFPFPAGGVP
ncbi:hypothetical protein D3C76_1586780 [compost metagenome]